MKIMLKGLRLAACGMLLIASGGANAAITINIAESGSSVVVSVSGSANTAGLTNTGAGSATPKLRPGFDIVRSGVAGSVDTYEGVTGPSSFGSNVLTTPTSGTGDLAGIGGLTAFGPQLDLPRFYTSGSAISSTSTYSSATISSLGLTAGTYVYTWGSGANADSLTLTVIAPAPTVTSITPTSGSTTGGTAITITGTNFTGATGITVGGTACTAFSVVSATSATCTTPAGTAGTASVVVTTSGGSNAANTLFTYTATPSSVPTLSEWSQMLLALMVMMIGWHFQKQRSY